MTQHYSANFNLVEFFALKSSIDAIGRNKTTKHYKYADLAAIREALEPTLGERWVFQDFQNGVDVVTRLYDLATIDATTQAPSYIESTFRMADDLDPQDSGKAITYGRRYNRITLLDLQTEDNDAAGTRRAQPGAVSARQPRSTRRSRISEAD